MRERGLRRHTFGDPSLSDERSMAVLGDRLCLPSRAVDPLRNADPSLAARLVGAAARGTPLTR